MPIFQKSVIKKHLKNLDNKKVDEAYEKFQKFYGNKLRLVNIMQLKEENYQEGFLREIFVQTLGYIINPDENFNLTTEFKNQKDARKADGAILSNSKAVGVVELKSTKTKNLESIKEQAFGYKNNQPGCKYVITSNFQYLRFYVDNATEYEEFNLFQLDKEEFKFLYLLLSPESIFSDLPAKLKQETKFHENDISDKLYSDYKQFKDKIFTSIVENNPQYDKLILFKKSQKLLDRFLFVFFAEDCGLIPPNTISKIVSDWKNLKDLDFYQPLYKLFRNYFSYLDKGKKIKDWGEIPAYNGGLFRADEILDNPDFKIDDVALEKDSLKLSAYDFNTDVDVNILGHIFEHSLNEIEEITAELQDGKIDKKKSKRKKDGVFYTPKYITKYIVENTVGTLCNEKKDKLQINNILIDEKYRKKDGKTTKEGKKLFKILHNYKDWLLTLKILDPACGSGAFLNQTLEFLVGEHKQIDDLISELTGESLRLYETDKSILENNIFGVDINEESVEIAKLSLWLRTAQKGRPLSDLSHSIKCGNSLIDDPEVAGDKAFNWNAEFKEIMNNGGFDVVVGNPPYVFSRNKNFTIQEKSYYLKNYRLANYQINTYALFTEKGIKLLKKERYIGYIIPNNWLTISSFVDFRKLIIKETGNIKLINLYDIVFSDANVDTTILICKNNYSDKINISKVEFETFKHKLEISKKIIKEPDFIINFNHLSNQNKYNLVEKINSSSTTISENAKITTGLKAYQNGKGKPKQTNNVKENRIFHSTKIKDDTYAKYLKGKDVNRYSITWSKEYLSYGTWLAEPRKSVDFTKPRILVRQIPGKSPYCIKAVFTKDYYLNDINSMVIINIKECLPFYMLAFLNSKLISFWFTATFGKNQRKIFPQFKVKELSQFPIHTGTKNKQEEIANLAKINTVQFSLLNSKLLDFEDSLKSNLNLNKMTNKLQNLYNFEFSELLVELKKQKIKIPLKEQIEWREYFNAYKTEINELQSKINQTDKEIDKMVYEIYELTDEEIEIVENSVK